MHRITRIKELPKRKDEFLRARLYKVTATSPNRAQGDFLFTVTDKMYWALNSRAVTHGRILNDINLRHRR